MQQIQRKLPSNIKRFPQPTWVFSTPCFLNPQRSRNGRHQRTGFLFWSGPRVRISVSRPRTICQHSALVVVDDSPSRGHYDFRCLYASQYLYYRNAPQKQVFRKLDFVSTPCYHTLGRIAYIEVDMEYAGVNAGFWNFINK